MSTHDMFSWRNKKNIISDTTLYGAMIPDKVSRENKLTAR